MWYFEATHDPLGGLNKQVYVGLSETQAKFLFEKFYDDGWGSVRSGLMEYM